MAMKTKKPTQKMQAWIEARKRHHLSHAQAMWTCLWLSILPNFAAFIPSSPGAVEAALAAVYRGALLQTVRQDFPRSGSVCRGAMPTRSS